MKTKQKETLSWLLLILLFFAMNEISLYIDRYICVDRCVSAMPMWCMVRMMARVFLILLIGLFSFYLLFGAVGGRNGEASH